MGAGGSVVDIEWVRSGDEILALIVRRASAPARTTFLTPDEFTQQAGFVVYPKGGSVVPHEHLPIPRQITGTQEALLIWRGRVRANLFDSARRPVAQPVLEQGDVILLVSGGHGFTMLEDTILFEIKQGPYTGLAEKERFDA
jgi:hypothetical protein